MHYASPKHKRCYRNTLRGKQYPSQAQAALYLLTADRKLWRRWHLAVSGGRGIDWEAGRGTDPGWDGTALEKAARCIAGNDKKQVTLHDLLDRADYPQELLRLVVVALIIARNDPISADAVILKKGRRTA